MSVPQERIAGRALDAEVLARVFGFEVKWLPTALSDSQPHYANSEEGSGWLFARFYSRDIAPAFQVVEAMRAKASLNGCVFVLELDGAKNRWEAVFDMPHGYGAAQGMDNPALAICTAALAALDAETLSSQGAVDPLSSSHTGWQMSESMQGKRVEWHSQIMEPGEYAKLPDGTWMGETPNGHGCNLANHHVVEHDDGTITVSPSIGVYVGRDHSRVVYHGYLERGVWREC